MNTTAYTTQDSSTTPEPASISPNPVMSISPAPSPPATAATSSLSLLDSSAAGWAVALALLFSVRQGRLRADADRLDVR